MATVANSAALFDVALEKVAPLLQDAFEMSSSVAALIQAKVNDTQTVSDRLFVIPIKTARGTAYRPVNLDGGALGRGAGPKFKKFTCSRFSTRLAAEFTWKADFATNSADKSRYSAADTVEDVVKEAQRCADIELHQSGNGVITGAVGASAATQNDGGVTSYVFADSTDMIDIVNFAENMEVHVFNNAGTTRRYNNTAGIAAPSVVTQVDPNAKKIYLNHQIDSTTPIATDIITFAGVTASLTTGGNFTGTPPLSPDSWRHGIPFYNDASTSNYMMGVAKNTITNLLATQLNAGGAYFNYLMVQQALDKVTRRRDDYRSKYIGIVNEAARYSLAEKAVTLQSWQRTKETESMFDMIPKNFAGYDQMFTVAGVLHMVSKRQPKNRVDYIYPELWGRNELHPAMWAKNKSGGRLWDITSPTDGSPTTTTTAYWLQTFDNYCKDPGRQVYITGLGVPLAYQ